MNTHITCSHDDCRTTLTIDVRHSANFEGRRWLCAEHAPHLAGHLTAHAA